MNTPLPRRHDGFTLVELLVVIAIIAVLAGAGFSAGISAVNRAKRTKCLATATGLESAITNFYSEYNYAPKTITDDTTVNTKTDTEFLNALLGYTEIADPPLNPRALKFFSANQAKPKGTSYFDGLAITGSGSTTTAAGLFDPWGGPYFVELDGNYDEVVSPAVSAGGSTPTLNGRKAAVWSNGADAAPSGTGGKVSDDVITWSK